MQETQEDKNTLFEEVKEYISLRSKILTLQVTERTAVVLSNLISNGAAIIFFIIFFVFASIGLAMLAGQWVNNTAGGFFIIAGLYLLIGLIIWFTKERMIEKPLADAFVKNFFKDKTEDDEQD